MLTETFSQRAVDFYVLGFLITANLLTAWFHSNFAQHVWNLLHPIGPRVYTKDDLTSAAVDAYGGWGDLWVCPICLGTWMSLFVAFLVATVVGLEHAIWVNFIIVAITTWPLGFYAVHRLLSR